MPKLARANVKTHYRFWLDHYYFWTRSSSHYKRLAHHSTRLLHYLDSYDYHLAYSRLFSILLSHNKDILYLSMFLLSVFQPLLPVDKDHTILDQMFVTISQSSPTR